MQEIFFYSFCFVAAVEYHMDCNSSITLYIVCLAAENTVSDVCWQRAVLLHVVSCIFYVRTTRFAYIMAFNSFGR